MKFCNKCKTEKDESEFSMTKRGLYYCCNVCKKKYKQEWTAKNKEKLSEYHRLQRKKFRITKPLEYYIKASWTSLQQRCVNGEFSKSNSIKNSPQMKSYHKKEVKTFLSKEQLRDFWNENFEHAQKIIDSGKNPMIIRINTEQDYTIENIKIGIRESTSGYKYNKEKKKIENKKRYLKFKKD